MSTNCCLRTATGGLFRGRLGHPLLLIDLSCICIPAACTPCSSLPAWRRGRGGPRWQTASSAASWWSVEGRDNAVKLSPLLECGHLTCMKVLVISCVGRPSLNRYLWYCVFLMYILCPARFTHCLSNVCMTEGNSPAGATAAAAHSCAGQGGATGPKKCQKI